MACGGSEPAKKSGQNIPKNRCRTTIAERIVETLAELPFIGDQVSRAGESHPRALAEPDVRLSPHPAPIVQPRPCGSRDNLGEAAATIRMRRMSRRWHDCGGCLPGQEGGIGSAG